MKDRIDKAVATFQALLEAEGETSLPHSLAIRFNLKAGLTVAQAKALFTPMDRQVRNSLMAAMESHIQSIRVGV